MNLLYKIILFLILSFSLCEIQSNAGAFTITRIHYGGGGDWYSDPSSIPNLLSFVDQNTNIMVDILENRAKIGTDEFYKSFYLYLTGHGNINFSDKEIIQLRKFLINGGFLHADDNYGMDKTFRREMKKIFPDKEWVELPPSHLLFNIYFKFEEGLPKIHEHNNKRPQAFALFHEGEIIVLYTFESDLGDGWEDQSVHNNSPIIRNQALKMGTNIILYSLSR